jgi:hypothetical protein
MSTPEYERWTALEIRRPDDVRTSPGGPVPLTWMAEKHSHHADRLANRMLPEDFPHPVERGDAGDALAALALREAIRRDMELGRGNRIHEALRLGATWSQVAAALDVTPGEARELLRAYADGQQHLYRGDVERGLSRPLGFSPEEHAATVALCELADDQSAAAVAAR